jgi:putative ABC transport system permease protein
LILIGVILSITLFLKTELGLRLRAVGLNQDFAKNVGVSVQSYTVFGLFIAGCLSGLAGSLMVQLQNYMDVGMGTGILIHALAALMIGEAIIGNSTMAYQLMAPLVGAIIYQQIQGVAITCGLAPSDLKFFTGSIVLIVIAVNVRKEG